MSRVCLKASTPIPAPLNRLLAVIHSYAKRARQLPLHGALLLQRLNELKMVLKETGLRNGVSCHQASDRFVFDHQLAVHDYVRDAFCVGDWIVECRSIVNRL